MPRAQDFIQGIQYFDSEGDDTSSNVLMNCLVVTVVGIGCKHTAITHLCYFKRMEAINCDDLWCRYI